MAKYSCNKVHIGLFIGAIGNEKAGRIDPCRLFIQYIGIDDYIIPHIVTRNKL